MRRETSLWTSYNQAQSRRPPHSLTLTDHYGYDKATHEISSPHGVLPILFYCFQALD